MKVRDGHVGRPGLVGPAGGGGDPADLPDLLSDVLPPVVRVARGQPEVRAGRHAGPALAGLALLLRRRGGVRDVRLRDGLALDVQCLGQLVQSGEVGRRLRAVTVSGHSHARLAAVEGRHVGGHGGGREHGVGRLVTAVLLPGQLSLGRDCLGCQVVVVDCPVVVLTELLPHHGLRLLAAQPRPAAPPWRLGAGAGLSLGWGSWSGVA